MLFCGVVVIAWAFDIGVALKLPSLVCWMKDQEIYCRLSFLRHSQPNVMYFISPKLFNVAETLLH